LPASITLLPYPRASATTIASIPECSACDYGGGNGSSGHAAELDLHVIAQLPAAERAVYALAFTNGTRAIFLVATVVAMIGFAFSWLLPEHPLRKTVAATSGDVGQELGGAMAMPAGPDTHGELAPIVRTPPR